MADSAYSHVSHSTATKSAALAERAAGHDLPPQSQPFGEPTVASPWLAALEGDAGARRDYRRRLWYLRYGKRAIDIVLASILLILAAPFMLVIALLLRFGSPGPVIFRQTRVGLHGQPFTVYKFRSMIPDRRRRQADIPFNDRRQRHKSEADPRVTRVGRFLRRTSLDELPQLFNVIRGNMSLVGPRPEITGIVARYDGWQHARHLVRPGVTGWWQISGRSSLPMHENTELDIYYVEHVSLWLDIRILLRTILAVTRSHGAY